MKPKIPTGQTIWMTKYDGKGNPVWVIASDIARTKYYLYKSGENGLTKVKTGKSPKDLEEEVGGI